MRFKEKVAIITGSGQGIGQSIARRLASEGASVIINDMNLDVAQEKAEKKEVFDANASCIQIDMRNRDDIYNLKSPPGRDVV